MNRRKESPDITVSVVDSDILMRQILSSMLRKEPGVRLAGSVGFREAEKFVAAKKSGSPDLPQLLMLGVDDIHSSAMDFFFNVREKYPDLHIVLMTPRTKEGAVVALEGLKHGAVDYVTKPDKRKGLIFASNHFFKRVLPLVKAVPRLNRSRLLETKLESDDRKVTESLVMGSSRMVPNGTDIIIMGSCLGGVTSIYKIVSGLPEYLPVPVIIVQHMPKIFTEYFAEDLDKITPLHVREAKNESVLLPGQVYVAPGGYHSVIKNSGGRKQIMLHRGPREHKCRPSIDVLLRSALQSYGSRILTVFLSGGGTDGIQGASLLLANGGTVLLESKESSMLWDMNEKIHALRPDIKTYSADKIASEILDRLRLETHKESFEGVASSDWIVQA